MKSVARTFRRFPYREDRAMELGRRAWEPALLTRGVFLYSRGDLCYDAVGQDHKAESPLSVLFVSHRIAGSRKDRAALSREAQCRIRLST